MKHKIHYLLLAALASLLLAIPQRAGAQCPGPSQRTMLINLQRANVFDGTRAGQIPLTDTCGNQRYVRQVQINLDTINYIPNQTGNTANLSEFVFDTTGALWYIDWKGEAIEMQGGGSACDQDFLQIADASCPDNINDSIYTQKYAAVGARYVWPGATFLVNDSSNVNGALQVIQGDRIVKLALYDISNEQWVMLHGNNTDMSVYVPQDGSFTVTTSSGTPENATADVPHFTVSSLDSTVTLNQYPNTRRDTQTIANFLYTDDLGVIRSQSVDSFPLAGRGGIYGGSGLIPDSTSAEVAFGGFFQIAYPSGVFDPAIRVTDNPPTVERQVEINSTNATIQVYPNNITVEAQDGINMLSNDGTENEGIFFCTPYSVGFSLDSTAPNVGWSRVYSEPEFSEMQAADGGTGGVATLRTYKSTGGGGPNVLGTVSYSTATYPTNAINIDTLGVRVQTFGSYGNTGQVLRNVGGWLQWQDTTAAASVNIYTSDGTISTNRTVTLSDTVLWDIASAAGAFHIEGLNNSYFRQSDNAIVTGTGGASFNLGSGTPIAMSMSLDAGTARVTDNRAGKVGIEYASAGYGADFTDSTLVHRRYVGDMISDSLATIPGGGDVLQGGNSFGAQMFLGTNDNFGLTFETAGTGRMAITGGASTGGSVTNSAIVSATNTVSNVFTEAVNSSGTAATGFGMAHIITLETSTTNSQDAAQTSVLWSDATHATRTSDYVFSTVASGAALAELFRMGGTTYALTATASVSNTNTIADRFIIRTNSSGTAAANFGGGILFQGESTTTDNQDMARITSYWTTATHASREAAISFQVGDNGGALAEVMRIDRVSGTGGVLVLAPTSGNATTMGNNGITTGTGFTLGNSAQGLVLGGSTGSVTMSNTSTGNIAIHNTVNAATSTAGIVIGNATAFTQTSGTRNYVNINSGFAPTSGTAEHNQFVFSGTFNQTGGANGITRNIYLNPTLTAVADFRGIDIAYSNSSAKGVYQSGASTTNNFVGGTMFGSTSAPASVAAIEVSSTTKGILFPRMTTTQRDAITAVQGLAIFNTTTTKLEVYDGTTWQACW